MRTLTLFVAAAFLALSHAVAQDGPQASTPPKELGKLDRLIGTFEGKGTAWMAPGAPAAEWTAQSRYKKALNGFVIIEETIVDLGAPTPLALAALFGYDAGAGEHVKAGITNMGSAGSATLNWADDNTFVTVETGLEQGQFVVDRWVTTLGHKGFHFTVHRSVGSGDFFLHVKGVMKRTKNELKEFDPTKIGAFAPVAKEMTKLARMAGEYALKGVFRPAPGMDIEISARERVLPLFGGGVLGMQVKGDPVPGIGAYEGVAAFAWNPLKKCYVSIHANSMGAIGSRETRFVGDKLVTTLGMMRGNEFVFGRSTMSLDADGAPKSVVSESLAGASKPHIEFEATYTRQGS